VPPGAEPVEGLLKSWLSPCAARGTPCERSRPGLAPAAAPPPILMLRRGWRVVRSRRAARNCAT